MFLARHGKYRMGALCWPRTQDFTILGKHLPLSLPISLSHPTPLLSLYHYVALAGPELAMCARLASNS